MPIHSRLLGLLIILVANIAVSSAIAKPNNTQDDTPPLSEAQAVAQQNSSDAQPTSDTPTAAIPTTTPAPVASPVTTLPPVVESQAVKPSATSKSPAPVVEVLPAPVVPQAAPALAEATPKTPAEVQTTPKIHTKTGKKAPVVESRKIGNTVCSTTESGQLQKSVLITSFPRITPSMANGGELYQVEQEVPNLISAELLDKHSIVVPVQMNESLPLADSSNDTQLAMQTQRLARNQHSQLVMSGEIVDMSMAHPEATYNPGLYTRVINDFFDFVETKNRFDKRDRMFSFQVHIRDGFTGQQIFSKRYNTYGIWRYTGDVGFGSALFWKSDYGVQIKGLIKKASKDVSDVIQCQPYIAQIDSRPGQTQIILQGGTNNGLRIGDTLSLYQLVVEGSETQYQEHDIRLVNRNAAIELREVYPSHSVGVINNTSYLTGQFLAVAP